MWWDPSCSVVSAWSHFSWWSREEIRLEHIQCGWNLMEEKTMHVYACIYMVVIATRLINGLGCFWRFLGWHECWMAFHPVWMKLSGNNKGTSLVQTNLLQCFQDLQVERKNPHTRIYIYFLLKQSNVFYTLVLEAIEIFNWNFLEQFSLRQLSSPVMKVIQSYRFHLLQKFAVAEVSLPCLRESLFLQLFHHQIDFF